MRIVFDECIWSGVGRSKGEGEHESEFRDDYRSIRLRSDIEMRNLYFVSPAAIESQ